MKVLSSNYWVLVADSGNARILEMRRKPYQFREVQKLTSEALHKRSRDLVSDGSGRSFHAQGPASHSKKQRSDAQDLAEQAFTRKLIKKLEQAANRKSFEHLVLVADPKTLGRLRAQMSKSLKSEVVDELNLDLVGAPLESLEKRVKERLNWPTP
ncbi:MAG: host attachment protein [Xanthomonadales bacterium]|nr:host attachment protein [Gammaproteobacteria bacterium]MBT8054382.1 host attachment protein [Gammaproteobacteria bacterium]NND56454.1 host attachment protein [Xanthomonadales bacterium]NNK51149.1 host attachment protein [Xanthomonadales bacterium]